MNQIITAVRNRMRLGGYSLQTEKTYLTWIRRYLYFLKDTPVRSTGNHEVSVFLTKLATERHVSINTQKIALNALVFLYHKVMNTPLGDLGFTCATKSRRIPSVLSAQRN